MDSCSFGSCLGPCLEHTAAALTKSCCWGVLATLAMCHPLNTVVATLSMLYLLKGRLLRLVPGLGHQLPAAREYQLPHDLVHGNQ